MIRSIFYSSPGKTKHDIKRAFGKCIFIADSFHELELLNFHAEKTGKTIKAGIRINPGFDMDKTENIVASVSNAGSYGYSLSPILFGGHQAPNNFCGNDEYATEHKFCGGIMDRQEKIRAITERNKQYDGKFYYGVKTTKIVCNPGCPARLPLEKNIVLFDTLEEAIQGGYRPCKICMKNKEVTRNGECNRIV